jgi:DNA-binding beta-propeller fold protein YncE
MMRNKANLLAGLLAGLFLMPGSALAQGQTSSGTLTVTAQVQSSISLTFITDPNGVALTGSGTNVATLNFGSVSQFVTPPSKVTETIAATSFTVSTPFDISVVK